MNLPAVIENSILVCDGAMGTMLHAAGNSLDQALPALNVSNSGLVRAIHDSYIEAGVDIIQTNTFGASRLRLSNYGFSDRVEEMNREGVRIAREAARCGRNVLVAGSVSPAVSARQRNRVHHSERSDALREQITALAAGGVDIILLETFGYLDELIEAIAIAAEVTDIPIIAQATFGNDAHTLSGHTAREVGIATADLPIVALGTNCTLGPQRSLAVLHGLREYSGWPLTVQPNAGLPRRVAPTSFEYDVDSAYFARYVHQLIEAGAVLVGGCCGTTPTQIAAAVEAANEHRRGLTREATTSTDVAEVKVVALHGPQPTQRPFADVMSSLVVALTPPPPDGIEQSVELARQLGDAGVDLCWVVPGRGNKAQVNSVDLALHLRQRLGIETMATVTTWDRTIMALQADLLGAHALGVRRIVCETGSPPLMGDYPNVDGVWDVDSIGLIELLAGLNEGIDYYGLHLASKTEFEIGARVNPGTRNPDLEAARVRDKISAGAQFLITRPIYELVGLERLLAAIDGRVGVLVTVQPLTGFAEAEYLLNEVPDVTIPASTLEALERAGRDGAQAGIELAAELAFAVRDFAKGIVIPQIPGILSLVSRLQAN